MKENDISCDIRGAAFKVHTALGPGLLESVYETAPAYELRELGYNVKSQLGAPMTYEKTKMDIGFALTYLLKI